jgi:hypothetical protein
MRVLSIISKILVPIAVVSALIIGTRIVVDYFGDKSTELGPIFGPIAGIMILSGLVLAVIEIIKSVTTLIKELKNGNRTES